MTSMIPRLRKAGIFVEKDARPRSRGMKYRLYRAPDETVAIVHSQRELSAWVAHLLDGAPAPGVIDPVTPFSRSVYRVT